MSEKLDLSVIIISSKRDYVFDCMKSLKEALNGIKSEVIFIDNASKDHLGQKISKEFSFVKVIRREENGGFGENNNLGMKVAKGKYVLLLNDDTKIIDKSIFKEMISWMDKHPKAGVSSCALVNPDGKTIQASGGYYPTLFRIFAWMSFLDDIPLIDRIIKPYHPMHGQSPIYKGIGYFEKEHRQDWVTGAFYLMRKDAMDVVGYFDEDFFLYVEETELSKRFIDKNWQIWYLPRWKIIHYGKVTTGSEKATIFELQNLSLLYKKHEPAWKLPILKILLKFGVMLRIILWKLVGKKETADIYEKAFKSI